MTKHFKIVNKHIFKDLAQRVKTDDVLQYVKYPQQGDIIHYQTVDNEGNAQALEATIKSVGASIIKGFAWITFETEGAECTQ